MLQKWIFKDTTLFNLKKKILIWYLTNFIIYDIIDTLILNSTEPMWTIWSVQITPKKSILIIFPKLAFITFFNLYGF